MEPTYALTTDTLDYTIDELDSITDLKVGPIPVSGDSLARLIRARRDTASATSQPDPYATLTLTVRADALAWGSDGTRTAHVWYGNQDRRMAAVGFTDGIGNTEVHHAPEGKIVAFHL